MREIKFEFIYQDGKYSTKATMTLDELLNSTEDDIYEKATEQYVYYSGLENFELVAKRQYTGLKDKNGIEIYEGDIVEYEYNSIHRAWWRDMSHKLEIEKYVASERENMTKLRREVVYEGNAFKIGYQILLNEYSFPNYFENISENSSGDTIDIYDNFKVIGNIYENKELLNG